MYAVQNQEANVIDSLSGSVSQWYADVDAAMKAIEAAGDKCYVVGSIEAGEKAAELV